MDTANLIKSLEALNEVKYINTKYQKNRMNKLKDYKISSLINVNIKH